MTLLPGVVLLSVAMAGIFFSAWRLRHRLMLAGAALVSVALAAGTTFGGDGDPGYVTLVEHAPAGTGYAPRAGWCCGRPCCSACSPPGR